MPPLRSLLTGLLSLGRNIEFSFEGKAKCSPDQAFAYISDVTRHPEWAARTQGQELHEIVPVGAEGPVVVGSRFRSRATTYGKSLPAELCVTQIVPHSLFAFRVVQSEGPPVAQGSWDHIFRLRRQGDSTVIRRTLKVHKADNHGLGLLKGSLARYKSVIEPNNLLSMENLCRNLSDSTMPERRHKEQQEQDSGTVE